MQGFLCVVISGFLCVVISVQGFLCVVISVEGFLCVVITVEGFLCVVISGSEQTFPETFSKLGETLNLSIKTKPGFVL